LGWGTEAAQPKGLRNVWQNEEYIKFKTTFPAINKLLNPKKEGFTTTGDCSLNTAPTIL